MLVRLAAFDGTDFSKGAGFLKTTLWYFVNALMVRASWNPFMGIKIALLRMFGAKIGKGLVIKNNVIIKSPWNLTIGDHCWLGEACWIDNLDKVVIGNNVCISQGALLLTETTTIPSRLCHTGTLRYMLKTARGLEPRRWYVPV